MAMLSPPFILCPFSDRKSLLGISPGEDLKQAIITVSKNIAIRYHVNEQKQETSWASSKHWLTSKVIFCPDIKRYGAIMDHHIVATWENSDTTLKNVQKFKFPEKIKQLVRTKEMGTLVVFANGCVLSLSKVVKEKKKSVEKDLESSFDPETDAILDVAVEETSGEVFLLATDSKNTSQGLQKLKISILSRTKKDNYELVRTLEVQHEYNILGQTIVPSPGNSYLLLLSCDGFLYRHTLTQPRPDSEAPIVATKVGQFSKFVSASHPVIFRGLGDGSNVLVYGCDPSDEGAVVFIYDIVYDLIISKQFLKLYGDPPVMEVVDQSVLIPVGLHILALTLRVQQSSLSKLVGKHQIESKEEVFEDRNPWVENLDAWDSEFIDSTDDISDTQEPLKAKYPEFHEIVQQTQTLQREGHPESIICNEIIPQVLETLSLSAIDWILSAFSDIPEKYLVALVSALMKTHSESNTDLENSTDEKKSSPSFMLDSRINSIIQRPCDQTLLTKSLNALDYTSARCVLTYLYSILKYGWVLDGASTELLHSILIWTNSLIDAHYTKFVFNNEIELVKSVLQIVNERMEIISSIEALEPLLLMIKANTKFQSGSSSRNWRSESISFIP